MQADAFAAGANRERKRAKQAYENKKKWMENTRRQLQISDENWEIATEERKELAVRWRAASRVHRYIPDPSLKRQTPRAAQVSIFGPGHFAQPFCPTVRMPFPPRREPPRAQISTK